MSELYHHPGLNYSSPPIPATTAAFLVSSDEIVDIDPHYFCKKLFLGGELVGCISVGFTAIEALLTKMVREKQDNEDREHGLLYADVCIDLRIPGAEQVSYLTMHYYEFERYMRKLNLTTVHDPLFVLKWAIILARRNEALSI